MRDSHDTSGLLEYVGVLRRHTLLIVFAAVFASVTATTITASGGARYRALTEVLLSRQDVANQITNLVSPSGAGEFSRITSTQAGVASSPRVARMALRKAGVQNLTAQQFLASSDVQVKPNTDILLFTVEHGRPGEAIDLANAYASAYVDYRRALDTSPIRNARKQARDRIKALEKSGDQGSRLYTSLVAKDEQLSTAEALQGANATIIRAAGTASQIAPRLRRNAVLAAFVGILLGVALAFLTEALNTRVRSVEELREAVGLPLLGFIAPPSRALRDARELVMLRTPNSPSAEAFRLLRTNLSFANLERNAKIILLTSAVPAEGKSTTVSNLAVTFARAGSRVVLVDLDLRRPTIAPFFRLKHIAGVTDVALGSTSLDDALQRIDLDNGTDSASPVFVDHEIGSLHVLAGGWTPPDIGEFIGGKALAGILGQLRERADFVFIDSPPILSVGDALAVNDSLDAIVVVARIDKLRRNIVRSMSQLLVAAPVPKLGMIATGGAENTGYGYGYGYGYGTEESLPSKPEGEKAPVAQ